jgi:hypothetical protein
MSKLLLTTDIKPNEGCLYYVKPKGANGCLEIYEAVMSRGGGRILTEEEKQERQKKKEEIKILKSKIRLTKKSLTQLNKKK